MTVIKLIVDGGAMKPGPTISQQLGPKGINIGKVIEDINNATISFKGIKVPVELDINEKTKKYEIRVYSPPVAELLKKELGLEKGSGAAGKVKIANAAIEQIIGIAKTKLPNMLARDLKNAVKLVLGSCASLGILVESKSPIEIIADVNSGNFDKEISQGKTEVSDAKKVSLEEYFAKVRAQQESRAKVEAEVIAAQEAAKAATATTVTASGATPTAEATKVTVPKTAEKKSDKKK
ncbi:50S ribosomal protein L11 [Candidatus Pacearchaeota archaeon]|nr:50S ribosomal protein L11 [Candidatus Pacearchaeota archaeon]